jgi:2-(1,2-epoxy-1,2-dihydrophenyl)acetyl-CoA isomerase
VSEQVVLFAVEGSIARVTLNRPECGNAIDLESARALVEAAIRCDADAAIRCVVLTGRGRMFCAGGDLALFAEAGEKIPSLLSELAGTLNMAVSRFMRMAKPLLVLINGPVAGAGLSLALSGDVVVAARSLLLESFPATLETHLEREARAISAASAGGERQEGIAAFLAKRKPKFASG